MRISRLILCCVALAGCARVSGGSSLPADGLQSVRQPHISGFRTVYSFNGTDGAGPAGNLTAVDGALWGTTTFGESNNGGTIFEMSPSGKVSFLYQFGPARANGNNPEAGLKYANGAFYGTTAQGNLNCPNGSVFELGASHKETVLYCFQSGSDGALPQASLIYTNGALYGTTANGSDSNGGTVFSLSTTGSDYRSLHSFAGGTADGANPLAGLTATGGMLYGTTVNGGANNNGTIFKISPSGAESVIYNFQAGTDGAHPYSRLIVANGSLWGTTKYGGANGYGTIFRVTTSGAERAVYSFKGNTSGADGANPVAGLVRLDGSLYGTTLGGGGIGCSGSSYSGCGTAFSFTPAGSRYHVLYVFTGPDGANPAASLTVLNGALYGTTQNGGSQNDGTVFRVSP